MLTKKRKHTGLLQRALPAGIIAVSIAALVALIPLQAGGESNSESVSNGGAKEPFSGSATLPEINSESLAPALTLRVGLKQLNFSWDKVPGATHYRLLEMHSKSGGLEQVGETTSETSIALPVALHLYDWSDTLYFLESCRDDECARSKAVSPKSGILSAIGYFKASNTSEINAFGVSVSISGDGQTLAVGAPGEASRSNRINGDQNQRNHRLGSSIAFGAVYVFRYTDGNWRQEAYIKSSDNPESGAFGKSVSLSDDGDTLAVGASGNTYRHVAGSVYVFARESSTWSQQAHIKGNGAKANQRFGTVVALNAGGDILAVGAPGLDLSISKPYIAHDSEDLLQQPRGAVHIYSRNTNGWGRHALLEAGAKGTYFGSSLAFDARGTTLAVGAPGETVEETYLEAGAVYIYRKAGAGWRKSARIQAANPGMFDRFGRAVAMSGDGNSIAIGAPGEDGGGMGINGDKSDKSANGAGAVYLFTYDGNGWGEHAYVKASNTGAADNFGSAIALDEEGEVLVVGAYCEGGAKPGVSATQPDNLAACAGAAYVYRRDADSWKQKSYVKAPAPNAGDAFGNALSLSNDGDTLAVGAWSEDSSATGINGKSAEKPARDSGAVYLY